MNLLHALSIFAQATGGLSTAGLVVMVVSIGAVLSLVSFCLYKVFRYHRSKLKSMSKARSKSTRVMFPTPTEWPPHAETILQRPEKIPQRC